MKSRQPDLVAVVEAAYALEGDRATWVRGVTDAAAPLLDRGKGVYAFIFDANDPARFQVEMLVKRDDAEVLPDLVVQWHRMLSAQLVKTMYWASLPLAPISQRLGLGASLDDHPAMQRFCRNIGVVDQLTVRATDTSYRGVAICAPLGEHIRPHRAESQAWALMVAHVSAGLRLRRALGGGDPFTGAEAVLAPDGRCHHAEHPAQAQSARDALREAVRRIDRARSSLRRRDPREALDTWRGLVDGRWSLVDTFDSDGRRFLVARSNAPEARDPRALSPNEQRIVGLASLGHSNKEIAYALGLSISTIATHLASARRKLGASSRVALIRAYRAHLDGAASGG